MNALWERFVATALRRHLPDFEVRFQGHTDFWENGSRKRTLQPDILLTHRDSGKVTVLDTKWKALANPRPSIEDLRQLYAYAHYFGASHAGLVYPGTWGRAEGTFVKTKHSTASATETGPQITHVFGLSPKPDVRAWMREIAEGLLVMA